MRSSFCGLRCSRSFSHSFCYGLPPAASPGTPVRRLKPVTRRLVVTAGLHPAKRSLRQWWGDTREQIDYSLEAQTAKILYGHPALRQVVAALALIEQRVLAPLKAWWHSAQAWYDETYDSFIQFTEDETRRKWKWSKKTKAHKKFWEDVLDGIITCYATLLYQVFAPLTVFSVVLLPLAYSWIKYDKWWCTPVVAAILVMLPIKFFPGTPIVWF